MYVEDKLKLNKFEHVSLPSNSELWNRSGCARVIPAESLYSSEESVPLDMRKSDVYASTMREEMNALHREAAEARDKAQEEEQ